MMNTKSRCWSFAKRAVKPIWAFNLTSAFVIGLIACGPQLAYANDSVNFQGHWAFDEDASDSHKKILRRLEKQLAIQKSFQYPQKKSPEKNNTTRAALNNVPEFLFSESNLHIQLDDKTVRLRQGDKLRDVGLQSSSKSFSLKQFTSETLTSLASIKDDKLFVDSTTSDGLLISEVFYIDDAKRLIQQLRINDGIHKSLYLQRVYLRCDETCR